MNIVFAGESFDCAHKQINSAHVRLGDFIVYGGAVCKVELNQRDCVSIENLNHYFVQWILRLENGQKIYTRNLVGKVEVYRPKTRKVA